MYFPQEEKRIEPELNKSGTENSFIFIVSLNLIFFHHPLPVVLHTYIHFKEKKINIDVYDDV